MTNETPNRLLGPAAPAIRLQEILDGRASELCEAQKRVADAQRQLSQTLDGLTKSFLDLQQFQCDVRDALSTVSHAKMREMIEIVVGVLFKAGENLRPTEILRRIPDSSGVTYPSLIHCLRRADIFSQAGSGAWTADCPPPLGSPRDEEVAV